MPPKPRRKRPKNGAPSNQRNERGASTSQRRERERPSSQSTVNVGNSVTTSREPEKTTISKKTLQEFTKIFLNGDNVNEKKLVNELMNELLKENITQDCRNVCTFIKEQCSGPLVDNLGTSERRQIVTVGGDKVVKILPRKLAKIKNKTKEIRKIYLGKRGGKYYIRNNRKIYVKD